MGLLTYYDSLLEILAQPWMIFVLARKRLGMRRVMRKLVGCSE